MFGSIAVHHNGDLNVSDALSVGFKSFFQVFRGLSVRCDGVSPDKIRIGLGLISVSGALIEANESR